MKEAALFFDKGLHGSIENIVVCGEPFFSDDLLLYPFDLGVGVCYRKKWLPLMLSWPRGPNLGYCKTTSYVTVAYVDIAPSKAQQTPASAFLVKWFRIWIYVLHMLRIFYFDMTVRHKAFFEYLRAPHAQDFLFAIPIDGLGQHMSPVEYRTILKYRLMIPSFLVDEICPICCKACFVSFGEHAVNYKELTGFKYQHDMVRNVLFDVYRRAGISAKKKALVNFLTDPLDGRSTLRHADVLILNRLEGTCLCRSDWGFSSRRFE
uniref:Putative reverse transcriptase domain-containing protein n=1 Tax=Tanacetum cinerariifolium TaxID=118510 RepID=A0A699HFJ6_TANCI|nr:putative reverse transcriptase domain-containing protein [Tanacetum cinerariifolium]GEY05691.1 putative reverse transcriptase domain-containing protein [Tanacetum cinerariifolium]GEY06909.1 putative reverse transcriptase domain-containing protein [Tanacetum cinerariifolium]